MLESHEVSLESIRQHHQPAHHFRVSANTYPEPCEFDALGRQHHLYVLTGKCEIVSADRTWDLGPGDSAEISEGQRRFAVKAAPLEIVQVWEIPDGFRRET
jgi:hypothetical protein